MSISLRASDDGIKQIKKAIKQVGFNQTSFAEHLKICTCFARKATKPLPYLHFTFIQQTLFI